MAASASTSLTSSSSSSSSTLGEMPSMSTECTPLKHRYDACFNQWFERYLGLEESGDDKRQRSATEGFWQTSSGANTSSSSSSLDSDSTRVDVLGAPPRRSAGERKALRERLDGQCGAAWKEYQSCVLRAVKSKDLGGLIDEARVHNPFPFPQDTPKDKPNNEPFPFPRGER